MICSNMVTTADAEILCKQTMPALDVKLHFRVASSPELSSSPPPPPSADLTNLDSSRCDSTNTSTANLSAAEFVPKVRSGCHTDIGPRQDMEDQHIQIDDLRSHLPSNSKYPTPTAFYAVFDGHGGPEAASFVQKNALKFLFEDSDFLQNNKNIINEDEETLLSHLKISHENAFVSADLALAEEASVSASCGTTALTALLLGNRLTVANAGDCRAVLCRKGAAYEMSQDHKPSFLPERIRVEAMGGRVENEYLNGNLSVTRALGDWDMKLPVGSLSPLIAEPDVRYEVLTEDDEFLIIGCDGIWDVMTSQYAVSLVRRGLRRHDDPQQCAAELVREALRLNTSDNLTAIVVCFATPSRVYDPTPRRSRFFTAARPSEEARSRFRSTIFQGL